MKKAFSLVELIVGITISMLLMVSIGVFVSSGMENIFLQQSSIKNASDLNNFAHNIYSTFSYLENTGSINITNSGIIFKRKTEFDKGGFTYIGVSPEDEFYCFSGAENTNTNHIFIKNFIPFEEDLEYIETGYLDILTGSVVHNGGTYISHQKEHKITDETGKTIVGKGIFGDFFEKEVSGTGIYLNSPTGLASDSEVLYISDTLNDRVLYLSGGLIYKLLDENDGLKEPTGLYYDNSNNELYIANSGKGEVLKYSSEIISPISNTTLSFSEVDESVENIYIDFFKDGVDYNITSLDIDTSNFNNNDSYGITNCSNNSCSYKFMSGSTSESQNFNSGTSYDIVLSNLSNFSDNGNYTIQLQIGNTKLDYYFFTQGDEKIYTKNDNTLIIYSSGLTYPTFIKSPSDITDFDLSSIGDLKLDKNNDLFLKTPIDNLDISENNDLLNIILKYYKNYNCYNLDQNKEKIRTFLSKINIK